jgi:2-methylcitrate dehydratase
MFDGDITNVKASRRKCTAIRASSPSSKRSKWAAVPTRVTAILLDGQRISREVDYAPGFAARPMNRDEVELKFRGNVGKRWPKERMDVILQTLWALDRRNDLASLLGELALPT